MCNIEMLAMPLTMLYFEKNRLGVNYEQKINYRNHGRYGSFRKN
jgi:hypothetical protein